MWCLNQADFISIHVGVYVRTAVESRNDYY